MRNHLGMSNNTTECIAEETVQEIALNLACLSIECTFSMNLFQGVMVRLMLVLAPVACILSGISVSTVLTTYMKVKEFCYEQFSGFYFGV